MSEDVESARGLLEAYAAKRGLRFYRDWSLPPATQLIRHGFMQEVPALAIGNLGEGLDEANLAHFAYRTTKGAHRFFTVVVAAMRGSLAVALRVLCHDRDLDEEVAANPDTASQIVELDDQAVRLESDAFLRRFRLATDHDQDQVRVWQLFSPALVEWLTTSPPEDFSFELQDGALCCFVPGLLTAEGDLDGLASAAGRVAARVAELAQEVAADPDPGAGVAGSRDEVFERRLAKKSFDEPPKSVKAAARKFGSGLLIGDESWRLGAEAFFRAYADAIGLRRMEVSEFRAAHVEFYIADDVSHVAAGTLPGAGIEGFLLLADDRDDASRGQCAVLVDLPPGSNTYAFALMTEAKAADDDGLVIFANSRTVAISGFDGGAHGRSRKALDEFRAKAEPLLGKIAAASMP